MQRTYSHARIRILCALAAMALLAACGDSHTNFLTNEADLQTAISQLRSAIGARPRVLKIEVEANVVAIEAQDPKNPNHVDRWRYVNFVFGPVSTQRLMGPDPVELNLLNPDLEANLFDLSVVDFSATSKLESAALKRAHLQDAALISRMEIARQTFILPEPSSGDVRWSLHIESGRERAEIHANASGAITHADLGGTMRAQTLNLTNEPALVVDAAADFRAKVGALPVVTKVSIDPKTVAFKTVIRDTTFGKAESGPPSYSSFTWDLNGLIQRLGVVDIRSATKLPPLPLFGVDEVNWTLVGKMEADALARVAIPQARVTEIHVEKSFEKPGAPVLAWTVEITDPDDEKTLVVADANGVIGRVVLPQSRRPKLDWRDPATLAGLLASLAPSFGPDASVALIMADEKSGRITLDDPAKGGEATTFDFTANGLARGDHAFVLYPKGAHFAVRDLASLTQQKLAALEADALKRLGSGKQLYLHSLTIGSHPFAPKASGRAIEVRLRDTPESSSKSNTGWIVYDFDGHALNLSAP